MSSDEYDETEYVSPGSIGIDPRTVRWDGEPPEGWDTYVNGYEAGLTAGADRNKADTLLLKRALFYLGQEVEGEYEPEVAKPFWTQGEMWQMTDDDEMRDLVRAIVARLKEAP